MKYNLIGVNGNAFAIMGYVIKAMKAEGKTQDEINSYQKLATYGDYQQLLKTSMDVINHLNDNYELELS